MSRECGITLLVCEVLGRGHNVICQLERMSRPSLYRVSVFVFVDFSLFINGSVPSPLRKPRQVILEVIRARCGPSHHVSSSTWPRYHQSVKRFDIRVPWHSCTASSIHNAQARQARQWTQDRKTDGTTRLGNLEAHRCRAKQVCFLARYSAMIGSVKTGWQRPCCRLASLSGAGAGGYQKPHFYLTSLTSIQLTVKPSIPMVRRAYR